MAAAIKKVRERHASVNSAAKEFDIPEATLRWRLKKNAPDVCRLTSLVFLAFCSLVFVFVRTATIVAVVLAVSPRRLMNSNSVLPLAHFSLALISVIQLL